MVVYFPLIEDLSDTEYSSLALKNLRGISFAHLNIRGLVSKIDNVRIILTNSQLSCLVIGETFLNDSIDDSEIAIKGYRCLRSDRTDAAGKKGGGGLVVYTSVKYTFTRICNSEICSPDIECVWLKLTLTRARPTYICATYRPPSGNVDRYLSSLEESYNCHVLRPDADFICLGDTNIDYLAKSTSKTKLDRFLRNVNCSQIIKCLTRVTLHSKTLIDHIYCNNSNLYSHWGSIEPGLSDHQMVYVCRKKAKPNKEKKSIFIRCYRKLDPDAFNRDVAGINWEELKTCNDLDEAVSLFNFEFMKVVNLHMPYKRIRTRVEQAPWVTNEHLSLIDRREYLGKKFDKCPCEMHLKLKKDAERMCDRLNAQLKRDYIENTLDKHRDNPKKLWRHIRNLWPNSKKSNNAIQCIGCETDPEVICELLNDHFSTVGVKVQENIVNNSSLADFPITCIAPVFEFKHVSQLDLSTAITKLSSTQSSSIDGITSNMIKTCRHELIEVLLYLFNKSIDDRKFPSLWKHAKVTALSKSGAETDPSNYRPISILSTVGKLLKRVIQMQCTNYLSKNQIISPAQSGFRKGYSTGTCLSEFLNSIYMSIDKGDACGVLFLDLAKAFDTVDHEILIYKLQCSGF